MIPPELLTDEELTGPNRELALSWAYNASFRVTPDAKSAGFRAAVIRHGKQIGNLEFDVKPVGELVVTTYAWVDKPADSGNQQTRQSCMQVLDQHQAWLKIYYDSGHTISGSRCFLPSFRDEHFDFAFKDISTYAVKEEKPRVKAGSTLAKSIGVTRDDKKPDNSLFAFVLKEFRDGWLACDDGSMEFADFVHVDAAGTIVTLIHVKAAKSQKINREVSVSSYEIVVGQAIKNLRYLDRVNLRSALETGKAKKIGAAVWLDGTKMRNRDGLIDHVENLRPNHKRRVVIVQPQLTKREHDLCLAVTAPKQRSSRFKQLTTLLLAARQAVQSVGANIEVWGAQ